MGAANGEVIREPFDTKPSDQWVGCLLISLRSKGVARRSHVVGFQEMLYRDWPGAACPVSSPLCQDPAGDHRPRAVSWCTLEPHGHIPDAA